MGFWPGSGIMPPVQVVKRPMRTVICLLAAALLAGGFPFRGEAKSYSGGGGHSYSSHSSSSGGSHSFSSGGSHSFSSGGSHSSSSGRGTVSADCSQFAAAERSTRAQLQLRQRQELQFWLDLERTAGTATLPPRATAPARAILLPPAPAMTIAARATPSPRKRQAGFQRRRSLSTPLRRAPGRRKPARRNSRSSRSRSFRRQPRRASSAVHCRAPLRSAGAPSYRVTAAAAAGAPPAVLTGG